jgi:hypothetical protein
MTVVTALAVSVPVSSAAIPTTWIPGLAIGAIVYVLWLYFRQALQVHKDERERRHARLAHWGHE